MYTQLAEIPVPTAAHFANVTDQDGSSVVQVVYTIRDHSRNIKRTMTKSIVISSDGSVVAATPLQDHDIIAQVVSPSGKLRAVLRNAKSGDSPATRLVEIWNKDLLEISANVTECHGDFYADEYLASFSFAPSESAILYTAEGKIPETKNPFEKFRFNPDFGEGLVGKKRPVTFILRWDSNQSTTDKLKPTLIELRTEGDVRFGQASFSPNSDKIIYATGYEFTMDGRILGLKGCYNRPSGIWQLRLPKPLPDSSDKLNPAAVLAVVSEKLTPGSLSCRSPRTFKHDEGSTLAWLACPTGGAHVGASALYSLDISSDSDTTRPLKSTDKPLVAITKDEIPSSPDLFPGLYPSYNLPPSSSFMGITCGPYIVTHSQWGSRNTVLFISTQDGAAADLTPSSKEEGLYSWTVLATDGRSRIICQRSSSSVPYEVLLGHFVAGHISWHLIDKPDLPEHIKTALSTIRTSIVAIPNRYPVETILIQPNNGNNTGTIPPLITYPHGGPHGTTSTAFSATTTALVLEGYTVSLPNYTGSLGYGDGFVQRLIGNCGTLDVEDCYESTRHLIKIGIAEEGPGKQFVMGGSHGGFLGAHLIAQFPDMFSAAVLRNPVISAGAISSSDIPDWYFSEFGIDYPLASSSPTIAEIDHSKADLSSKSPVPPLVSSEIYARLSAASPISRVDSIKIPVLLLIGAADRRVAPSQGIEFYHALKARYTSRSAASPGVRDRSDHSRKVDMLMFEGESHPLDGVEAAKANFEVTREWLADAVQKN